MHNEVPKQPADGPLLIVITDTPDLPRLRSRQRTVRCWVPHDSPEPGEFGGDPALASCYGFSLHARSVTAIIDIQPPARARAALAALRTVRPDAAVLILSSELSDLAGERDGTLARAGELRDVLRFDLDEELERLEAERHGHCLRRFAEGADVVPVLIHDDPDPDALSSALAVVALLGGGPDRAPIVTLAGMHRPENRRMAELLRVRVTRVTREELRRFPRIITVDMQPRDLQHDGVPELAVIDHHPPEGGYHATIFDVRPDYGATATMMTEYLRAAVNEIGAPLATALLFGIKTDTASLTRGVTAADVAAYGYLQERADLQLLRRFERPSYEADTARAFGRALADAQSSEDLLVTYLGELREEQMHAIADLADFCLAVENITWVAVAARVNGSLTISLRHTGSAGADAGAVARRLADGGGHGGGHATMARVTLPLDQARNVLGGDGVSTESIGRAVRAAIDEVAGAAS